MRKQILIFFFSLLTLTFFAQKKQIKSIEKALNEKNFNEASTIVKSLKESIKEADDKYKSKYYFLKGQTEVGKKDYEKAVTSFNQLFDFEKKKGKERYSSEARSTINKIIQSVSDKAISSYNKEKNYVEAAKYFYLTYKLSPRDTSFVYNAAVSATQAEKYDDALKYYKVLIDIGYTGKETLYLATNKATGKEENIGSKTQRDLIIKSGKYFKPVNKATKGKYATIIKNMALLYKEQGKIDEAIVALSEARKANPKDLNLLLNEGDIYIKLGKMDKFGELMNEAISIDPNNSNLYYNLGVINFNQGKREDAIKYYKKAIELKPDYLEAYINLSTVILDKEKSIIEEMNKNLSNFKKFDKLALQQKELYTQALPYLEKANELAPTLDKVKSLMGIYQALEMNKKSKEFKDLYRSMR